MLRRLTVIDSPGLDSIHEENSLRTTHFLTRRDVDAVLFAFDKAVTKEEGDVLHRFRVSSTGLGTLPSNTVGVLCRTDLLASHGSDPWIEARKLAASNARRLGNDISTVIPVIGLFAETAKAGVFREEDARNIHVLAGMSSDDREQMLLSERYFRDAQSEVPMVERLRLLGLLQLYGLKLLIRAARDGASSKAMIDLLNEESGVAALEDEIEKRLSSRRLVLKASRTITELERIAIELGECRAGSAPRSPGGAVRLSRHARAGGASHARLPEWRLTVTQRRPGFGGGEDPHQTDLQLRLGVDQSSASLFDAASDAVRKWTKITNAQMDPRSSEVARVVARTLEIQLEQLE